MNHKSSHCRSADGSCFLEVIPKPPRKTVYGINNAENEGFWDWL
jgi:hypothetical protein